MGTAHRPPCSYCEHGELTRAHRRGITDHLFACIGFYPYICRQCGRRCLRPKMEQLLLVACVACVMIACMGSASFIYLARHRKPIHESTPVFSVRFSGLSSAPGTRTEPQGLVIDTRDILRNEDIVKLSRSGIGGRVIAKLISKSPHRFEVDANSLVALKHSKVADEVIGLMIDVSLTGPVPAITETNAKVSPEDDGARLARAGTAETPTTAAAVAPAPPAKPATPATPAKFSVTYPFGTFLRKLGK